MTSDAAGALRVGFIGLGEMGGPMASHIIAARFPTVLWARRPEVLAEFAGPNVETAATPAELAARADVIGVCVWTDHDVREVLQGEDGVLAGARPGTVVALHSTIQPVTCRQLAEAAAARGVTVIDAPVSGGHDGAVAGTLVVAVGGAADAVDRCRPVFASFGDPVVHLGPVGSGQFAKLVNNALLAANVAIADDALTLGQSLQVEPAALAEVLRHGTGRSYGLDIAVGVRSSAVTRTSAIPFFEKDVRCLVSEVAPAECAASAPLFATAAQEAVRRLSEPPEGWAERDSR